MAQGFARASARHATPRSAPSGATAPPEGGTPQPCTLLSPAGPASGRGRHSVARGFEVHRCRCPWRTCWNMQRRFASWMTPSGTMFDLLAGKKAQLRSHNAFQVEAESATRQLRLWLAARDDRSLSFDMPLAGQQIAWRMTHKNEKRKPHHCSSAGRALGPMVQQARWLRHGARYPVRCWSQPARLLAASAHPPTDFGNVAAAAAGRAGARRDAGHRCGSRGLDIEKVGLVHYYDVPS